MKQKNNNYNMYLTSQPISDLNTHPTIINSTCDQCICIIQVIDRTIRLCMSRLDERVYTSEI